MSLTGTIPIPSQTQVTFFYKTESDFGRNLFYRVELVRRQVDPLAVPKGWPVPWVLVKSRELPPEDPRLARVLETVGIHLTLVERHSNRTDEFGTRTYTYPILTGSRESSGEAITDDHFWADEPDET